MRTHLVQIGNSQGVRLPRAIIEEAKLSRDLDVVVEAGAVVIRSAPVRAGWASDARACHEAGDDSLADWDATIIDGDWQ